MDNFLILKRLCVSRESITVFGMSKQSKTTISSIQRRLLESNALICADEAEDILYQHSILCQTCLPYRNPGDDIQVWERVNGHIGLSIQAGRGQDGVGGFRSVGLPFGPKPRLILAHINSEAIRTGSSTVDVGDSMTAFIRRLGIDVSGKSIKAIKEQLLRLSKATIQMDIVKDTEQHLINTPFFSRLSLWYPQDPQQKVLWHSEVRLSEEYFDSLQKHAVPLDERALRALSHSAMGLDIYAWLAQRLHRVPQGRGQFVSWAALKGQFGAGYERMADFKKVFRRTLKMVHTQYQGAKFDLTGRGMTLHNSVPPVKGRMALVSK